MNKEDARTKIMLLIREQKHIEKELRETVQEYCDSTDESIPYRKVIREEFGLVI